MQGGIFVSYRRDDAAASAGRLCDHLLRHFRRDQVFFDVDNIEPGLDFVKVLDESVSKCEVLLAVIGRQWVSAKIEGRSRLASPTDFVRIELESALRRDIRVVPVLVDGATMPTDRQLPKGLKSLARRQAVQISHSTFAADTDRLINVLKRHFQSLALPAEETLPAVEATSVPEAVRPIVVPTPPAVEPPPLAEVAPPVEAPPPAQVEPPPATPEPAAPEGLEAAPQETEPAGPAAPVEAPLAFVASPSSAVAEEPLRVEPAAATEKPAVMEPTPVVEPASQQLLPSEPPPAVETARPPVEAAFVAPQPALPEEAAPPPPDEPDLPDDEPPVEGQTPLTLGQMLAGAALAHNPELLAPLDRIAAEADAETVAAAPAQAKAGDKPPHSSRSSWLAGLIFPVTMVVFVLYALLDLPAFWDGRDGLALSAAVIAAITFVVLLAVVLLRRNAGMKAEPTLFYSSTAWSLVAVLGFFASMAVMSGSNGPWPLFVIALASVAGYCLGILRGALVRGRRGALTYFAYFTPLAVMIILVWPDVLRGFDLTPKDPASFLAVAYLPAYLLPYALMMFLPVPVDAPLAARQPEAARSAPLSVLAVLPFPVTAAIAFVWAWAGLNLVFGGPDGPIAEAVFAGLLVAAVPGALAFRSPGWRSEPTRFVLLYSLGAALATVMLPLDIMGLLTLYGTGIYYAAIVLNVAALICLMAGWLGASRTAAIVAAAYAVPLIGFEFLAFRMTSGAAFWICLLTSSLLVTVLWVNAPQQPQRYGR